MKNKIIITNLTQVRVGDKAYFKNCDFGFTVTDVDESDITLTFKVATPLSEDDYWADSDLFDHATREVDEPEWPDQHDIKLHVYLGADGRRYIYNPIDEYDVSPWVSEGRCLWKSREYMEAYFRDALPLTELELVAKESES